MTRIPTYGIEVLSLTVAIKLNNDCRFILYSLEQIQFKMQLYFAQLCMLHEKLIIGGIRQHIEGHLKHLAQALSFRLKPFWLKLAQEVSGADAMEGWLLWACRACWQGWSAASSAMTFASSLPPSCRQSVAHALLTCRGGAPAYFLPGFAPLSLAWGWLLVGLLLRALTSKVIEQVATRAWPSPAPCSNGAGGRCAACSRRGRRRAFALRGVGRRKRAGYGSGGSGAAAGRVAGNIARGPIAGSAQRRGANPSADQCESLGPPPPAPLATPRQRRPSVTCLCVCAPSGSTLYNSICCNCILFCMSTGF